MVGVGVCRARLLKSTCSFEDALADFQKILGMRPGHKTATKEVGLVQQAQQALTAAKASR